MALYSSKPVGHPSSNTHTSLRVLIMSIPTNDPTSGLLDLKVGDPKHERMPETYIDAKNSALKTLEARRYPAKHGLSILREAVAVTYDEDHGVFLDSIKHTLITHGAWEATIIVLSTLARYMGVTRVGLVVPCFFGFYDIFRGLNLSIYPIDINDLCSGDDQTLDGVFSPLAGQAFIHVNPHNPTGRVFTPEQNRAIARCCRKHNVVLISDFVYGSVHGGRKPESALEYAPEGIEFNSFSKRFCMAGQRIGYVVGKGNAMEQILDQAACTYNGVCSSTQVAAAHLLLNRAEPAEFVRLKMANRREYLSLELAQLGFEVNLDFNNLGTNFVWAGISDLFASSDEAVEQLAEAGVLVMSGLKCGTEGYLRFALNYDLPELEMAIARIARVVKAPIFV